MQCIITHLGLVNLSYREESKPGSALLQISLLIFTKLIKVKCLFLIELFTYLCCSDNRIKVGVSDGPNFQDFLAIQHSNKVSQGMAFRGTWGWDDSYLYIGNMEGGLDVISMFEGKTVATFKNRYVSAMPWRFAAHPCHVGMLAGATGGGEVYIWTS
ncbi:hypothetical protein LIER_43703 [Lithospermum erythrorhizon]|uniref:Uncharacterized protein n=1 Tax=Lithospermum erythrorhizon TaxID=34254 RepID=A0AAV3QN87_LITER